MVQRKLTFLVPLAVSLVVSWVLVVKHHSVVPDAQSRLSNAYFMLFSRDPHAAAIGFVWNPLPSLVDLPLILFKSVWPVLTTEAYASNLATCLFFAATCWQLYRFFEELDLNPVARWGLWLCFGANPLVFYYGVNGMSEMIFLLPLVVTARYLSRWLSSGETASLAVAAFGLAFAYLARDEAVAPAAAAGLVVAVVSYRRAIGPRTDRLAAAGTDLSLFALPFVVVFTVWAVMSWVIVGHFFEQFSSLYGNSNQVRMAGSIIQKEAGSRFVYAIRGSQAVAPLLILALVVAGVRSRHRRDARLLAPVAVIVAVLVFEIVAYTAHQTFPWFRFYIYACPAAVMAAACLAVPVQSGRTTLVAVGRSHFPVTARRAAALFTGMALLLSAPGILTTADTLGTPGGIASSDRFQLAYFLWPTSPDGRTDTALDNYQAVRGLSAQIDAMGLPRGSLMVDVITPCVVGLILDSSHPEQYVIPSDQGYTEKFGAPYQFGVRYFLVPNPATDPDDSLNLHYPSLYYTGQAGLATLVRQINLAGCPNLRLYKVVPAQV